MLHGEKMKGCPYFMYKVRSYSIRNRVLRKDLRLLHRIAARNAPTISGLKRDKTGTIERLSETEKIFRSDITQTA